MLKLSLHYDKLMKRKGDFKYLSLKIKSFPNYDTNTRFTIISNKIHKPRLKFLKSLAALLIYLNTAVSFKP